MIPSNALAAARREVDALAARAHWSEAARSDAHGVIDATATGSIGPREIAQRYRAVAKTLDRASRARLWQAVRRVAKSGLRTMLDAVYRNEL
ncbi:MAG TPA: hypothetical protein VGD01_11205 [Candidatus Elarobacter sp.]|jgi:hypothetical protein